MEEPPIYIGTLYLSRILRYRPYNTITMIRRWRGHPELPCPEPDAYFHDKDDEPRMLWRKSRLPEWIAWNDARIAHGPTGGRPPAPGKQPHRLGEDSSCDTLDS